MTNYIHVHEQECLFQQGEELYVEHNIYINFKGYILV
jgi:hypothetical protein